MKPIAITLSASLLGLTALPLLTTPAFAAGGMYNMESRSNADFTQGMAAVKSKNWAEVITRMKKVIQKDENNADAWNQLGHAYRQTGDMENSFKHYDRALAINPKHRAAHEYIGEGYLQVDKLDKAEEHLEILKNLCRGSCEEYAELKEKVAAYKASHPA